MTNSLGGAHLSNEGLHLGHFFGSIQPYIDSENHDTDYYFVIRDRGSKIYKNKKLNNFDNYKRICSQIYAINQRYSLNIKVVRQSKISPYFQEIIDEFINISTLKQMINAHPLSASIKSGDHNMSISDFIFMLETAATFALLGVKQVYFTGNDSSLVSYCNMLINRMNKTNNTDFCLPEIQLKRNQVFKGYNYKKMNINNNNCIYLCEEKVNLEKKIRKLFNFKHLFKIDEDFHKLYLERKEPPYPDVFMPLQYINFFSKSPQIIKTRELYKPMNKDILYEELHSILSNIINPNTELSLEIMMSNNIQHNIRRDEYDALKIVNLNIDKIRR